MKNSGLYTVLNWKLHQTHLHSLLQSRLNRLLWNFHWIYQFRPRQKRIRIHYLNKFQLNNKLMVSFKSILITVSHHMKLYANFRSSNSSTRAFHMQIQIVYPFSIFQLNLTPTTRPTRRAIFAISIDGADETFASASVRWVWRETFKWLKRDLHCYRRYMLVQKETLLMLLDDFSPMSIH